MREDLIDRRPQREVALAPVRPWFCHGGRWVLPGLAASRRPRRARQMRILLLLIAASAFLCYGSLVLGWRFVTEHREVTADESEAWAAGAGPVGAAWAHARARAASATART